MDTWTQVLWPLETGHVCVANGSCVGLYTCLNCSVLLTQLWGQACVAVLAAVQTDKDGIARPWRSQLKPSASMAALLDISGTQEAGEGAQRPLQPKRLHMYCHPLECDIMRNGQDMNYAV